MKKLIIASFLICFALTGFGQITGSAHDFSGLGWNTTGEICIVCHTPHNADVSVLDAPLWNHELSAEGAYTLYSSSTLDATLSQPLANSKLCLSCHDGSVALGSFGGVTGTGSVSANSDFGSDLSGHHPISFLYNNTLYNLDGELNDPDNYLSGISVSGTIAEDMLFSSSMECASCHDVHNNAGNDYLLLLDNAASALCLTCHDK